MTWRRAANGRICAVAAMKLWRSVAIDFGVSGSQDGKMGERVVRNGAMPMPRPCRHECYVSWFEGMVIVVGGDKTAPRRGNQHLVRGMAVRPIDRAILERHRGNSEDLRERFIHHLLGGNRTDEDRVRRWHALRRSRRTCRIAPILALPSGWPPEWAVHCRYCESMPVRDSNR